MKPLLKDEPWFKYLTKPEFGQIYVEIHGQRCSVVWNSNYRFNTVWHSGKEIAHGRKFTAAIHKAEKVLRGEYAAKAINASQTT